jgi:hypothetical protein
MGTSATGAATGSATGGSTGAVRKTKILVFGQVSRLIFGL